MPDDVVTTVLELVCVALLAVGLALVVAVRTGGGALGAGCGAIAAAVVLAAASGVLRWLQRPEAPQATRQGRA